MIFLGLSTYKKEYGFSVALVYLSLLAPSSHDIKLRSSVLGKSYIHHNMIESNKSQSKFYDVIS